MPSALGSCNVTLGRWVDLIVPVRAHYCAIQNGSENVAEEGASEEAKSPRRAITRPVDNLTSASEIVRRRHEQGRRREHTDNSADGDDQGAENSRCRSNSHPSPPEKSVAA